MVCTLSWNRLQNRSLEVIKLADFRVIDRLAKDWQKSGLEFGDTVLVHSNCSRIFKQMRKAGFKLSIEDILQSFIEAIGLQGTLLLPLFNFDFTQGAPFNISTTPSRMGSLTEAGRKHSEVVRTGHPIYSFAVIGKHAPRFVGLQNFSGYGSDSPLALLRELDGKIAVLDLAEQDSMTFYHHVEEMDNVPYRYHKTFRGLYTDTSGKTEEREFGLFVRNLKMGVHTHVNPMGEYLWATGRYKGARPGKANGLRVIFARAIFDATQDIIRSGKAEGMLYRIEKL